MRGLKNEIRKFSPIFQHLARSFQTNNKLFYSTIFKTVRMKLSFDLYPPPGDREQNLPPVIMMHGMLDSRKTWKHIAPRIASQTGRKVYAVDARNHGESPWDNNLTFDINADDLAHFLSEQNIPKAAIVGHSMGGRTAIGLALRKPEMVEKIAVEDMNLRNFKPSHSGIIVQIIHMMRESLEHIPPGSDEKTAKDAIAKFMISLLPPDKVPKKYTGGYDMSMLPLRRDGGGGYCWEANLDVIEDMLTTDKISQSLSGVYMGDALFIYGMKSFFKVDKDPLIPKVFPRAKLLGIERATHLVHFEFADRFVDEVSSFINGDNGLKAKY